MTSSHNEAPNNGFFVHHGFWAPGVRLFRILTFRSKAILISVMFLIPLLVVSGFYGRQGLALQRFTEREQQGLSCVQEVLPLVEMLQKQRHLAVAGGTGAVEDAEAVAARATLADRLRKVVEAREQTCAGLVAAEPFDVLRANYDKISKSGNNPLARYKRHTQTIDAALAIVDKALDASGLSQDPDLLGHHLIQIGLDQLPQVTESVLALADLGLVSAGGVPAALTTPMMMPQRAIGLYLDNQVRIALDTVLAQRPELAERIAYAGLQETLGQVHAAVAGVGEEGWTADKEALVRLHRRMAEGALALRTQVNAELALLENARIDQIRIEQRALLALMLGGLAMAAYMFASFSRVMQGGLNEVQRHLRAMTEGDLTTSPRPWGKDEAARLMRSLSDMQQAIRDIVQQVRHSAEGIVDTSRHISDRAGDLAELTHTAATALQRSAKAMDDIGVTVRQTAGRAGEATEFGRVNANAAARGGQVIHHVISTMQDIRGASNRIGEIIGVIDGIAFQTNILALNAAVEAARAGESGRGFAVVASEVRSLAQRSATAAREIKVLVGSSVDKVTAGANVVQQAGDVIGEMVATSQRVNSLLDGIASGTRAQADGVLAVGRSVVDVDSLTQSNSMLVQQTAIDAQALQDQAMTLASRVAKFRLPEDDPVAF